MAMKHNRKQPPLLAILVDQQSITANCDSRCFTSSVNTPLEKQLGELKAWIAKQPCSEAIVSLDASRLLICEFELPEGAEKLQEAAVCFQAESYLPVSIDETAALCFRVRTDPHVLFVTMPRKLVTTFRELADRVVILPRTLALVATAAKDVGKSEQWFHVQTDDVCEYVLWANGQPKRWLVNCSVDTCKAVAFEKAEGITVSQNLRSPRRDVLEGHDGESLSRGIRKSLNFSEGIGVTAISNAHTERRIVQYCQFLFVLCLVAFIVLMLRRNNLDDVQAEIFRRRTDLVKTVFPDSSRANTNRRIRSEIQKQKSHAKLIAEWKGQERRAFVELGTVLRVLASRRDTSIVSVQSDGENVEIQLDVVTRTHLDLVSNAFQQVGFKTEILNSAPANGLTRALLQVSGGL